MLDVYISVAPTNVESYKHGVRASRSHFSALGASVSTLTCQLLSSSHGASEQQLTSNTKITNKAQANLVLNFEYGRILSSSRIGCMDHTKSPVSKDVTAKNTVWPAAPKDGRCLINTMLPTELLSCIFEIGTDVNSADTDDDDDDDFEDEDDSDDASMQDADGEHSSGSEEDVPSGPPYDRPSSHHSSSYSPTTFQVLVSHVCKRWREVAIANPALWSTIEFHGRATLERSVVYIARSKHAPLTILIDISEEDDRVEEEGETLSSLESAKEHPLYVVLDEFLELIKPHCQRLRELEVMVSHYLLMQRVLETLAICPDAPLLETLRLYFYEEHIDDEHFRPAEYRQQDFVLFAGNVPRLTKVALWGVHLDWTKSTFLSGLTELEMAYHALDVRPSYRDFVRILQTSPELVSLSLCQSGPAGMPVEWLESVVGSDADAQADTAMGSASPLGTSIPITSLVLAFLPPDYLIALLDRISIPNVQSLALDFDDGDYTEFLRRISIPGKNADSKRSILAGVSALKLSGIYISDSTVIPKAYSEMQNLVSINVNFTHVEALWYDLLRKPEIPTVYLPKLQILTTSGLSGSEIRALVDARIQKNHPLKEVYIDEEDDVELDDDNWLRANLTTLGFFENEDDEDVEEEEILFGLDDDLDMSDDEDDDEDDEEEEEDDFEDADVEEDDGDEEWTDMD